MIMKPEITPSRHLGPEQVRVKRPFRHQAVRPALGTRGRRPLRQAPPAAGHIRQRRQDRQDLECGGRRVVSEGPQGSRGKDLVRGRR